MPARPPATSAAAVATSVASMTQTIGLSLAAEVDRSEAERRLATVALAGVLLLGALLRVWGLTSVGLNSDEAVYSGQAAALAGSAEYQQFFAIFRAHPLLVQFLVALLFQAGVNDVAGRLLSVGFGVATIGLTYALGARLFSPRAGLVAAALLAVMPYHVGVSRQILLDGPMTAFFVLTIYLLARYAASGTAGWLYAAAFTSGLTFLAKETGILVVAVGAAFALMTPTVRLGARRLLITAGAFLIGISPYPASILLSGASETARQFLIWQLLRRPNHTGTFYLEILPDAVGGLVLVVAVLGGVAALRIGRWQDRLLLAWVLVPFLFYELWPVKGYQYLLPIAPAICLLVTRALDAPWRTWIPRLSAISPGLSRSTFISGVVAVVLVASLLPPTIARASSPGSIGSLAGTGGLPGGREAGQWIRDNVPIGSTFITIGPTLANIVEFYGHRAAHGLSVSPNPQRRNPAYDPIINADRSIQTLEIQYAAVDIWSAARSPHFATLLNGYIEKYSGRLIHQQRAIVRDAQGLLTDQVVIEIYALRP
jgi:hypothetical protein